MLIPQKSYVFLITINILSSTSYQLLPQPQDELTDEEGRAQQHITTNEWPSLINDKDEDGGMGHYLYVFVNNFTHPFP